MLEFDSLKVVGIDIEASSLDPRSAKLFLLQLNTGKDIYIIDCQKVNIKPLLEKIRDNNILVIGHNLKYDIKVLFDKTGILLTNLYDTMIAENLIYKGINNQFTSLKSLVEKYAGVKLDKDIRSTFIDAEEVLLTDDIIEYAKNDVKYLFEIMEKQLEVIENIVNQKKILDLELKLIPVVAMMEYNGIFFDLDYFKSIEETIKNAHEERKKSLLNLIISQIKENYKQETIDEIFEKLKIKEKIKIRPAVGTEEFFEYLANSININSSYQIKAILEYVGVTTKTTNRKDLEKINHDLVKLILEYREYAKMLSAFTDTLTSHIHKLSGRIHAEFNQLGTRTGRFSSSNPNLQQIVSSNDFRKTFRAPEGKKFICADFSQQELRILASVSGEDKLIKAYMNGDDVHAFTASILFHKPLDQISKEERNKGKSMNFAVVYGSSEYGIMYNFSIPLPEAKMLLENFWKGYPTMREFINLVSEKIIKLGYSVTMYGRRRYFEIPKIYKDNFEYTQTINYIKRAGVNHIIQGTGADIIKLSLIEMFYNNPFGDKFKILLTVHDEIVCEVDEDIAEQALDFVRETMLKCEQPFLGSIPAEVTAKISDYWEK